MTRTIRTSTGPIPPTTAMGGSPSIVIAASYLRRFWKGPKMA